MEQVRVKVLGFKRRGRWMVAYERNPHTTVIYTCKSLWMARKRIEKELGGFPWRRPTGQVAIMLLLWIPIFLAGLVMVCDYAVISNRLQRLQSAVDLAATAGAAYLPADHATAYTTAMHYLQNNVSDASGTIVTSDSTITVLANETVSFIGSFNLKASATAINAGTALHPNRSNLVS